MSIEFEDHSAEVMAAFNKAKKNALTAIGMTAEGHAKDRIAEAGAIVTGRLMNSITYATKENEGTSYSYSDNEHKSYNEQRGTGADPHTVYVGTNVEYAPGIELGTHRKAGAVHFLQDAVSNHSQEYKELAAGAFKNAD